MVSQKAYPYFCKYFIKSSNNNLTRSIQDYRLLFFSHESFFEFNNPNIIRNIKESNVIIIKKCQKIDKINDNIFFLIGFEKTLIIFDIFELDDFCQNFLTLNPDLSILFLSDTKEVFYRYTSIRYKELEIIDFYENTNYFIHNFMVSKNIPEEINVDILHIVDCLSSYLFAKSYLKTLKNRIDSFSTYNKNESKRQIYNEDDYIELKWIGNGCYFSVTLIYLIENEELRVIKKPLHFHKNEYRKLIQREIHNYHLLYHPFIPKFYGEIKDDRGIIIEFINGKTLMNISELHLNLEEKVKIIFEIMLIIHYLHHKGFVYRDLKPNNIIIDQNKDVILIDFDRMIKLNDLKNDSLKTSDFASPFAAPEINCGEIEFKNDIYSIGKIIYYIINETPQMLDKNACIFKKNIEFKQVYYRCINENRELRPSISELVNNFFNSIILQNKLSYDIEKIIDYLSYDGNFSELLFKFGYYYYSSEKDINKAYRCFKYAANQNHREAQFKLGLIYYENENMKNIRKSIHYFSLAAKQNHPKAQFNLGLIYYKGDYVTRDINKSIHYYTLAADQNYAQAQLNLGIIYYEHKYSKRDITKAIHFFLLAANQNNQVAKSILKYILFFNKDSPRDIEEIINCYSKAAENNDLEAQCHLGIIYYEGKFIARDINKSIHYLTLAANKYNSYAQLNLGSIYYSGEFVHRDINKAIYFFSLAAIQNNPKAQFNLGLIYEEGKHIMKNIDKAIHYYALAANQNHQGAQYNLGIIYYEGQYITKNIDSAIQYLTAAANNNNLEAQFSLGLIYYDGKYIARDILKAIHYYSLAANQNHREAEYKLGIIYFLGDFIERDIFKSIHYFTLAANQFHLEAIYNLGTIFYIGDYIKRDIKKSIHYFSLAADQNHLEAIYNLGTIYLEGKYVTPDIYKAIDYFMYAVNQNHIKSQFYLGLIYYEGQFITRDIYRSIYYFLLAANQNNPNAQNCLGHIYYNGRYIKQDINKSIYYFLLAANQNFVDAQFNLGNIYSDGKCCMRDIKKAIYYYSLAANHNHPEAQNNLGTIYYEGKYIIRDINKAIHYLSLAANQNDPHAQYNLGCIYLSDFYGNKNINPIKGIDYLMQSALNGNIESNFAVGFFYNEGKYVARDITKSIRYYKEASSFNNQYAKNNLGIIYKNGFQNQIQKNIGFAIEYFTEAIKRFEDKISMYNLANIFIYYDKTKDQIDQSIELLIKSSSLVFTDSINLLCIALIIKFGDDFKKIKQELINKANNNDKLISIVCSKIRSNHLLNESAFNMLYQQYKTIDFMYDFMNNPIQSAKIFEQKQIQQKNDIYAITQDFYEGFGI